MISDLKTRYDIEPGRLLLVRDEIYNFHFLFVNMYAPNGGPERVLLFEKLARVLKTLNSGDIYHNGRRLELHFKF